MRAVLLAAVALMVMTAWLVWAPQPIPAAPAAQGCPSCHGVAGKQPALDVAAKAISGHPAVAAKTVTQCMVCHAKGPTPKPFRQVMHKIHVTSTKFPAKPYNGTCTSCHTVDKATGTVTVIGLEQK